MYRAKDLGRNRYEIFDETLRHRVLRRMETEGALHRALERGEMQVVYQPTVSLTDGRVVGVEALARWHRRDAGLVYPGEFIALAEETGLIVPIGLWILEEACRQAAVWRRLRPDAEPFTVWVNLSTRQLVHSDLVSRVAAIVEDAPPMAVGLEITESAIMSDPEAAAGVLHELRELGVGIAIDDFGTGYSSLGRLRRLPTTMLKIDRSFVSGLPANADDEAIVTSVVTLAHSLGLQVTAEGVETPAQLEHVTRLGCDLAQGYHLCRPLPARTLELRYGAGLVGRKSPATLRAPRS
jgi:EAL domain-containing protein (putative c-di-GMP-specific phosphodiesterase class I)